MEETIILNLTSEEVAAIQKDYELPVNSEDLVTWVHDLVADTLQERIENADTD